jgi:hypothetical protein
MLGGDRDRIAEAEAIGLAGIDLALLGLALIGDQQDRRLALAQAPGEMLVERRHAGAAVDHQQRDVGFLDRGLGLLAHPGFQAVVERVLEPGGVDHREIEIAEMRLADPAVAGDAGLIVDDRQLLADQAVEQGGLAHIGASDDGDGEGHDL